MTPTKATSFLPRFLAGAALSSLTLAPLLAQEVKGPNITPGAGGEAAAVASLALAHELYAIGRAQGDALTVLAAARIAATISPEPGRELKRSTSGKAGAAAETGTETETGAEAGDAPSGPADAGAMFDLALSLAGHDPYLAEVIRDARDAGARGRIGGAFSHSVSLNAGRTDSWEIPFAGGAYAELAVIGAGLSDLDILVTDENGNVICFEGSAADALYCDFVPSWDGFFYVAVENKGSNAAGYELITN